MGTCPAMASGGVLSVLVLLITLAWATVPSVFAPGDPLAGVPARALTPPDATHWFGTDHLGRDLYTRVVHGTALSVAATAIAVALALVVGTVIGLLAGFLGGLVDDVLMRLVDVLLAVPPLLMSLTVITVLGSGTITVAIAVGVASVAGFARVMRAEVLRVRQATFVEAAVGGGVRPVRVLLRHVLPNATGPVGALTTVEFGQAFLAVAALGFLGFGAAPPQPEWGLLVSEGRGYLATSWWYTTLPGLVIVAVVLAATRLGRALKENGRRI